MNRREERPDLLALCGLATPAALDDGAGVELDPETPPEVDELTHSALLALYSELLETREATGCPRVATHCDALGAILCRHEPNGYG